MGLDSLQILLPAHVLAVHLPNVRYEEGIFIAGLADLMINVGDTLVHNIANHKFSINSWGAMVEMCAQTMVAKMLFVICCDSLNG